MSQKQRFYVRKHKQLFKQRVVLELYLADRKVFGRPPIGVHLAEESSVNAGHS